MEGMPNAIMCQLKSVAGSGYVHVHIVNGPFSTYDRTSFLFMNMPVCNALVLSSFNC